MVKNDVTNFLKISVRGGQASDSKIPNVVTTFRFQKITLMTIVMSAFYSSRFQTTFFYASLLLVLNLMKMHFRILGDLAGEIPQILRILVHLRKFFGLFSRRSGGETPRNVLRFCIILTRLGVGIAENLFMTF